MTDQPRIALVTGGNRGLGFELCHQLSAQGYRVLLGSRNAAAGLAAAETLREEELDVTPLTLGMPVRPDAGPEWQLQLGMLVVLLR